MAVYQSPTVRPTRTPNCEPTEMRVDARGLVHDWRLVTDDAPGDLYRCTRCGVEDID